MRGSSTHEPLERKKSDREYLEELLLLFEPAIVRREQRCLSVESMSQGIAHFLGARVFNHNFAASASNIIQQTFYSWKIWLRT